MSNPIKSILQKAKENEEKDKIPELTPDMDAVAYYEMLYLKYKTDIALIMGVEVTGFEKIYQDEEGNISCVVDIETKRFMIYVTLMETEAEERLMGYKAVNKDNLQIILFAPNYCDRASIQHIEGDLGVKIIYSLDELKEFIPY